MKKVILLSTFVALFLCLVDVAIISHITFFNLKVQTILIFVIYIAIYNGAITGTVFGFIAGLLIDSVSLAPLGLHSFVFVLLGYIIGQLYGKYNVNKLLLPCLLTFISLVFQALIVLLLSLLFGDNILTYNLISFRFWLQTAISVIFAPILFTIFNLFSANLKVRVI